MHRCSPTYIFGTTRLEAGQKKLKGLNEMSDAAGSIDPDVWYHELFPNLHEISSINEFRKRLPDFATAAIRGDDTFRMLLLAGEAMRWHQWQSAAQLYAHAIVSAFDHPWDEQTLVVHAGHVILLSHSSEAHFKTSADIALFAYGRCLEALGCEGFTARQANNWMMHALHEISLGSTTKTAGVLTACEAISPDNASIEPGLKPLIGSAHAMLVRTARRLSNEQTQGCRKNQTIAPQNLLWLVVAATGAIVIGWLTRNTFHFPLSSSQFDSINWLGAALISWPLLLVSTWVFAFFESRRTKTLHDVHPKHLLSGNGIIAGEIMPFGRDLFFHVFQFIWIPILIIALLLMAQYEDLPKAVAVVWAAPSEAGGGLAQFVESLRSQNLLEVFEDRSFIERIRMLTSNDSIALVVGGVAAIFIMFRQMHIQKERVETAINFYWWDKRVSRSEWWVRLGMVGVDTFLGVFLLFKIAAIAIVAYQLISADQLRIMYFAPDGVGGMKFLMDIFKNMSWLVFFFGLFVIASVYLHWNLPEYRITDAAFFIAYIVLVGLTMMPLLFLDSKLDAVRESMILALPVPPSELQPGSIGDAARMLRDVNEFRNWNTSVWSVGLLNSPIIPLVGQLLFAVVQFFVREGGANRGSLARWPASE